MQLRIPEALERRIAGKLASGLYGSADEMLRDHAD
jgi:Arc/MetJ-type ribon-helix-helix transcriptional regulator